MARIGETIDRFFEFEGVTGVPQAALKVFDGVGALATIAQVIFTQLEAGSPELWVGRTTIPLTTEPGSHVIIGTVTELSVTRRILELVEVNTTDLRSLLDDVAAPGRENEFATFVKERLDRIAIAVLRTLDAQMKRSPVEVEQIDVVFTRERIVAGDTPLFDFQIIDPITLIPVDIRGGTITFKGVDEANPSFVAWNRTCTIIDGEKGKCEVRLTANDTATPALYDGVVTAVLPGNIKKTAPTFFVNIVPAV